MGKRNLFGFEGQCGVGCEGGGGKTRELMGWWGGATGKGREGDHGAGSGLWGKEQEWRACVLSGTGGGQVG